MIRLVNIFILLFSVALHASPPVDPKMGSVTEQDFFFYSCVREYMLANSIQVFDGSVSYGVEYSSLNFEQLSAISKAAKQQSSKAAKQQSSKAAKQQSSKAAKVYAGSIRAPDYKDIEHGLPAVLVLCQNESKKYR